MVFSTIFPWSFNHFRVRWDGLGLQGSLRKSLSWPPMLTTSSPINWHTGSCLWRHRWSLGDSIPGIFGFLGDSRRIIGGKWREYGTQLKSACFVAWYWTPLGNLLILPRAHRSSVAKDEYNALVLAARKAKERLTGVTPLVGACVPALFSTALARIKMALIPNLTLGEFHGRDGAWTCMHHFGTWKCPLAKLVERSTADVSTVGLVYKPSSNWGGAMVYQSTRVSGMNDTMKPWPSFVGENCPYVLWSKDGSCFLHLHIRTYIYIPMFGFPLWDGWPQTIYHVLTMAHSDHGTYGLVEVIYFRCAMASARWFQLCCSVCPCLKRAPKVLSKYVFWIGASSTNTSDFNRCDREILIVGST